MTAIVVVLSVQVMVVTAPVPLKVGMSTQLAWLVCVLGNVSVASDPFNPDLAGSHQALQPVYTHMLLSSGR